MIPTTITLTLDDKAIETINRLISALEKVSPTTVAPVQPIAQVTPAVAAPSTPLVVESTQPVVSTAAPVPTAQAPVQPCSVFPHRRHSFQASFRPRQR